VFIAGGSTATFAMAWQPDGRGVRVFVADAADAVDASPPASVAGERGCDSTLPPRSSSVAFGAAVDGVAVHMDARPMHLLCDKLRHFPTHGVWALAWGLQPPLPRGFPPPETLASTEGGNGHRARQLGAVLSHSVTRPFASRARDRVLWSI